MSSDGWNSVLATDVEIEAALAELVPLVEAYGFHEPERAARLLLCVLSRGQWGNADAGWRREWATDIERYLADSVGYIAQFGQPPAPVLDCPAFIKHSTTSDDWTVISDPLRKEIEALMAAYRDTSWVTKSPHVIRRLSWDLADLWEAGTGEPALAWRPNGDHYPSRHPGGRFYAFLHDLCAMLGQSAPAVSAVEAWLRERRDHASSTE